MRTAHRTGLSQLSFQEYQGGDQLVPIAATRAFTRVKTRCLTLVAIPLNQLNDTVAAWRGCSKSTLAPALAPQRVKVRRPVVAGDYRLAVYQERRGLDAEGS